MLGWDQHGLLSPEIMSSPMSIAIYCSVYILIMTEGGGGEGDGGVPEAEEQTPGGTDKINKNSFLCTSLVRNMNRGLVYF